MLHRQNKSQFLDNIACLRGLELGFASTSTHRFCGRGFQKNTHSRVRFPYCIRTLYWIGRFFCGGGGEMMKRMVQKVRAAGDRLKAGLGFHSSE